MKYVKLCVVMILSVLTVMAVGCTATDTPTTTDAVTDKATDANPASPWTGTWKLNPEKSKAPGGHIPHPTSINIITVEGNTMTMVADHTDAEGKSEHVEYTATLDGEVHPVTSTPAGPDPYTISIKNIDERTREFVEVLGTFTIKGRDVLSEDGMTFSRVVGMGDAQNDDDAIIQFFEKQ